MPQRARALVATLAVACAIASAHGGTAAPSAAPAAPSGLPLDPSLVGARTLDDPFYPTLGNGGYDVQDYDMDLTWQVPGATHPQGLLHGREVISLLTTHDLAELSLDLARATTSVSVVRVDGRPVAHRSDGLGRKLIVPLGATRPEGAALRIAVDWTAEPQGVHRLGEGIPLAGKRRVKLRDARGFLPDGEGGFLLASQPNGAHTLFPSNDHPLDKATFTVRLTTPPGMLGVATGERIAQEAGDEGTVTTTWRSDQPVATHVLAMGVGRSSIIEDDVPGGPHLRSVVPAGLAPLAGHRLDTIDDAVTWLEGAIGRDYPFGSMGVQLAPPGATGAVLEGQTLVLAGAGLLDPRVDACAWQGLLVHETAHQWFGDSVSLVRWDQKWLSEGHATWYQRLWEAESGCDPLGLDGRMAVTYAGAQAARDAGGPPDEPRGPAFAYDATIYDQGALALDALRCEVGDETFRAIEGAWLDRYRDASASTDDFIDVATDVAGRDLRPFLESWLRSDTVPPFPCAPAASPSPPAGPHRQSGGDILPGEGGTASPAVEG